MNRVCKRLMSVFLALILLVSSVAPAFAATGTRVLSPISFSTNIDYNYYDVDGTLRWSGGWVSAYNLFFHYIDGELAYCLEPNRNSGDDVDYDDRGFWDWPAAKSNNITRALAYGAPNNGDTSDEGIIATQMLVWGVACGYVDGYGAAIGGRTSPFYSAINNSTVREKYLSIISAMATNSGLPGGVTVNDVEVYSSNDSYIDPDTGREMYFQQLARLEVPQVGKLKLTKSSALPELTTGNSCYSLEGAVYDVYTSRACTGNPVATLTTDAEGNTNTAELASGTYYLKERTAPKGFALDTTIYSVAVTTGKTTNKVVTDYPTSDPVNIVLRKVDAQTGETIPVGDGSLAGAQFTFRYYDGQYDTVAAAEASGAPTRSWVFETDTDGEIEFHKDWLVSGDEFYYFGGAATLPLGTLLIQETKAPEGYLVDSTVYLRNITDDGQHADTVNSFNAPVIKEQAVTGDIQLSKRTVTGLNKVDVPEVGATFDVYLTSAGSYANAPAESRDQLTIDKDGLAKTKELPYGIYTIHQTSGWEGCKLADDFQVEISENGKTYSYVINNERFYSSLKVVKIDSVTDEAIPVSGVGFQIKAPDGELISWQGVDTWYTDANGTIRLPMELEYGKGYEAVELTAPTGYILASKPFEFDVLPDNATDENGAKVITLKAENAPTQVSVSKVDADGNPVVGAKMQILDASGAVIETWTTTDTSHTVYRLAIGSTYTLREAEVPAGYVKASDVTFTINDTADVQPVSMTDKTVLAEKVDPYGNYVSGAELQVLDEDGTVVDEWTSDEKGHIVNGLEAGKSYVLHEKSAPSGWLTAEDVAFTVEDDGKNQTVKMEDEKIPVLQTTATVNDSHVANAEQDVELIDVVAYEKLVPGREYTIKGKLMDKSTGNPLVDADDKEITTEVTFTPTESSGTVDATFTFDASALAGKSIVVFEELYKGDKLLALHTDINDEAQTVHFPEIKTEATVDDSHLALAAEDITLTDKVSYRNLIPGLEYTVKGKLMDKSTGEPLKDAEEKEIVAETTFTPTEANGNVDVTFIFDGSALAGNSVVVFEELFQGDLLVATHADIEDEDQTVHFPQIKTEATVNGRHSAAANENITLTDKVSYSNLIPDMEYTVKGKLMDQSTGAPLKDANGKEITAEATFTPKKASGSVEMSFTLDASKLEDKSVVAFEKVFSDDCLVGAHEDLQDKDQTVTFIANPKTGDSTPIWLYVSLMLGSAAALIFLARRRKDTDESHE